MLLFSRASSAIDALNHSILLHSAYGCLACAPKLHARARLAGLILVGFESQAAKGVCVGRLTTIEDVEKQKAAQNDEDEMRAAQEAMRTSASSAAAVSQTAKPSAVRPVSNTAPKAASAPATPKSESQKETDFHGLDNLEKRSGGNIALIVIAVVIVIAAALKIAGVY